MSQKLSKADELYLRDMQNYLTTLQQSKVRDMEKLQHLSADLNLIRETIKLTKKGTRLTDSRIKTATKTIKVFQNKNVTTHS